MNKTILIWMAVAGWLTIKSFVRPSFAVALYMFTFLVAPKEWWWGDLIEDYRWNFFAGVVLLTTLLLNRSEEAPSEGGAFNTNAVPILALWAGNAILVHFLLSVNPDSSFGWLILRLKFILLFFMLQFAIRDQKDHQIVAMAITLGMGYIGYEATINERGSFSGGRLEGIGAAGVTSSNQLASLLITGLPLSVTLLFTNLSNRIKALVLVCGGLTFNVVLMCNSRGALLGLLLGGFAFLYMASGPARKQSRRIIALAGVATFLLLGDPEIVPRFMTTFTSEGQRDSSAQSRIVFWTAAREMFIDYPLGSGGNSFSEGRGWQYLRSEERDGTTRAIHNGFLTELVDWGAQGFVLMLLFIGAVWKTLFRGRRLALAAGDTNAIMVFACISTSLVAWTVSSIFGDYLNDEWGFWLAALAYSYLRVRLLAPASETAGHAEAIAADTNPRWAPAMRNGIPG